MLTDNQLQSLRNTGGAEEEAAEEIERLRAECEALRKDAERYRWLRDGCDDKGSKASRIVVEHYGFEWGSVIDAVMKVPS